MKNVASKGLLSTAALIAAVSLSNPASAGQSVDSTMAEAGAHTQTVSIPYSTAELTTDPGRASLYRKIRHAAKEVCGPTGLRETGSLTIASRNRKCYDEAVSAAISQVGASQLAAIGN